MHDLLPNRPGQLTNILNGMAYFMPELYLGMLFTYGVGYRYAIR